MTGTKGRSGGPRLGNPNKKRGIYDRSKARKSGAPMQNLHISKSAAMRFLNLENTTTFIL